MVQRQSKVFSVESDKGYRKTETKIRSEADQADSQRTVCGASENHVFVADGVRTRMLRSPHISDYRFIRRIVYALMLRYTCFRRRRRCRNITLRNPACCATQHLLSSVLSSDEDLQGSSSSVVSQKVVGQEVAIFLHTAAYFHQQNYY